MSQTPKTAGSEAQTTSYEDFHAKASLYIEYTVNGETLIGLVSNPYRVDLFCVDCGKQSTFTATGDGKLTDGRAEEMLEYGDGVFHRTLECGRDEMHEAFFAFRYLNGKLQKIGQFPSVATLTRNELEPYRKVLPEDQYAELSRAHGLFSHGVGIGSFVYLRRIFERLIKGAYNKCKAEAGWDEVAYTKARMVDKIDLLSHHLPPFLVENRGVYGILSKGIHELSESECLGFFPAVSMAIQLILDDLIAERMRSEKAAKAKAALAQITSKQAANQNQGLTGEQDKDSGE